MKDGNYVFDIPRIANDLKITMNEVFDRLQKLKVCPKALNLVNLFSYVVFDGLNLSNIKMRIAFKRTIHLISEV